MIANLTALSVKLSAKSHNRGTLPQLSPGDHIFILEAPNSLSYRRGTLKRVPDCSGRELGDAFGAITGN
jgi:hypothetical protein